MPHAQTLTLINNQTEKKNYEFKLPKLEFFILKLK